MSVWESVGSTYAEAVTAALPVHRVVLLVCGLLGASAAPTEFNPSVLRVVGAIRLSTLGSLSTGPLATATIGDLGIGIALVLAGWVISRAMLSTIFSVAARSTQLFARAQQQRLQAENSDDQMPLAERQSAVALIESLLAEPRSRLRGMNAWAELSAGVGLGLMFSSLWTGGLDLIVGLALLATSLLFHIAAVRLFLAEYFGPALLKARLQGREPPTPLQVQ